MTTTRANNRGALSLIGLSVLMILAGARAILLPPETGEGLATLLGCILILSGATYMGQAWHAPDGGCRGSKTLLIESGIALIIGGGYVLLHPQASFALVMYLMLIYLFGDSIVQFAMRERLRPFSASSWFCFEAIANTIIFGIMLVATWATWPSTPRQVIGVQLGISTLLAGVARLALSVAPGRAVKPVHRPYQEVE